MTKTFTTLTAAAVVLFAAGAAGAADLKASKAAQVAAPAPSMFDVAFGASVASDYIFRGISQSARDPSYSAYIEPRINFNPNLQGYIGAAISTIDFPNDAAAEVDLYFGIRPTFGKLALDIGGIYYWYPDGKCYRPMTLGCGYAEDPSGTAIFAKKDASFFEVYGKATYNFTDSFSIGGNIYYTDNYLNTGAEGTYYSATAKYVFPTMANGVGAFISGEFGRQLLGTSDAFYGYVSYPDYNTWNAGLAFTYKVFTLDLRYYDSDLNKAECYAITGDHTTHVAGQSKWCGATFVAKLSVDLTKDSLK